MLAEFGDDRYVIAKTHRNYASTSAITRASGMGRTTLARFVHNDRLIDDQFPLVFSALRAPHCANSYEKLFRARGTGNNVALRQPANRRVAILQ